MTTPCRVTQMAKDDNRTIASVHKLVQPFTILMTFQSNTTPKMRRETTSEGKTEKGQVYDCVNFYKQPAFSHRSSKTHIPTVNITSLQSGSRKLENLGLKDGCPIGTNAGFRVKAGEGLKLLGAHASISIWKPLVYRNEWSVSRMKILNGPDSIEAGWMVNSNLYNDPEAHLYARWTAGSSGCFNLLCPGFVQVSTDVPLGVIPPGYSHIGWQNQSGWIASIEKVGSSGCFNLLCPGFVQVSTDVPLGVIPTSYSHIGWDNQSVSTMSIDKKKKQVGYWPKSLFTSLSESGSRVEWGGEIDNPDSNTPPYMGSGQKAMKDKRQSAFYFQIGVLADQKGQVPAELYTDCDKYTSIDVGYQGDYWGRLIFYGGPYKEIE
ncbi:uncharacterized protein [Spinacia oleracea]|uniref:Neprosin PEP catalytic domain-containing protein n=1 Tax=Spinacia oleracea TaxID=3562 RepID=A0ABM3QHD8_SPIOL|nr:uncharacterized protein LOC110800991 [Spinacia oleracea]